MSLFQISEKFEPDVIVLASNTPSLLFKDKLPKNIITVLPPLEKIQSASNVAILGTQVVIQSKHSSVDLESFPPGTGPKSLGCKWKLC